MAAEPVDVGSKSEEEILDIVKKKYEGKSVRINTDDKEPYIAVVVEVKGCGVVCIDKWMLEVETGKYLYFTSKGFVLAQDYVGEGYESELVMRYISCADHDAG